MSDRDKRMMNRQARASSLHQISGEEMKRYCKIILENHEHINNLEEIIYSLTFNDNSVIRIKHREFVKAIIIAALDTPDLMEEAGKLFVQLLLIICQNNEKRFTEDDISHGFDELLIDSNKYSHDYPHFAPTLAGIIATIMLSDTPCYDNDVREFYRSLSTDEASLFFIEILRKLFISPKETQNITKIVDRIEWMHRSWLYSKYIPFDRFMSISQLNKHFTNDLAGGFMLTLALVDKIRNTDEDDDIFDTMRTWISENFSSAIIKCSQFMRSLTIAIIVCLTSRTDDPNEDFFEFENIKIIIWFLQYEPYSNIEIEERAFECFYAVQLISPIIDLNDANTILKLFSAFYLSREIDRDQFHRWDIAYDFQLFQDNIVITLRSNEMYNTFYEALKKQYEN